MFRAGAVTDAPGAGLIPHSTTPGIMLCDVSEFQPNIADATYLAWSRAVVVRALYGVTVDRAWYGGARRADLHAGGARFLGIYGYLRAGMDAAAQAHALTGLVGNLRQGEKLICDIEEGPAGAQAARWRQWSAVITAAYGQAADPWLYTGLSFASVAGLDPQWVAAYRAAEPGGNHVLWQFTDAYPVPGVGTADASVYHGSIDQLAAHGWQAVPVKPPVKPPVKAPGPDLAAKDLPELRQGATGAAVRKLQGLLRAKGYPVAVDGVFGPATLAALKNAQRHYRLTADGVAGPLTWSALGV
jgi:hypothetical protein